MHLQK